MQRQQAVRDLEMQLDQDLETPRDMSNSEGARKLFQETGMRCILVRRHDE